MVLGTVYCRTKTKIKEELDFRLEKDSLLMTQLPQEKMSVKYVGF